MPPTHTLPLKEFLYETPKHKPVRNVDGNNDFLEEGAKKYGIEKFGSLSSPNLIPYIYNVRLLNTQYVIRKAGDIVRIGNSAGFVVIDGDITIMGKDFLGSECLRQLLTCKNGNTPDVTSDDLGTYK